jgi:integrase
MRPDPRVYGGKWVVDLRSAGFGQRYVLCAAEAPREEAVHLGYQLVEQLRGRRLAEATQARDLFGEITPQLFATALDAWQRAKRYDTEGGKEWGDKYTKLLRRELGDYRLSEFAPPVGSARLAAYVDELRRRELSGRTIRNRVFLARQVMLFAVERGWLPAAPTLPRMPPRAAPVFRWLTEAMFRALRSAIFPPGTPPAVATAEIIARRRVYLSWLFYTGVHTADADTFSADQLFLEGRQYIRHNAKAAGGVDDEQFEMPEPLYCDLMELQGLVGRPFFPAEPVSGGPWPHVARVMGAAALRLGFPHGANPRILRRSYAREMVLRGYTVREIADRMGHTDERMLNEIYKRTPRPAGQVKSRWQLADVGPGTHSGMARVLQISGEHGGR